MDRSEHPGREPADPRDHLYRPPRGDRLVSRGPRRAGAAGRDRRSPSAALVAACAGVLVFVVLAVYGALQQVWSVFFVSCVLTAVSAAYAIVEGERWRGVEQAGQADLPGRR
jgi:Flp pilus assembly protein TadB